MKSQQIIIKSVTLALLVFGACDDFIAVEAPRTDLVKETVFTDETTANAALLDIYYSMANSGFASGGLGSVNYLVSLSSDDCLDYATGLLSPDFPAFDAFSLTSENSSVDLLWSTMYKTIYKANAIIEGATLSTTLADSVKGQLIGEAKFIRAFSHFYLVNLFGDIPVVVTTDYQVNSSLDRMPSENVYDQIINDLRDAESSLPNAYEVSGGQRVRPNAFAASALLARVYLFVGDWAKAVEHSSKVINETQYYGLSEELAKVFWANNSEAIWQLETTFYPNELLSFYAFTSDFLYIAVSDDLVNAFEAGDLRSSTWVGSVEVDKTYYFLTKYQSFEPAQEYTTPLRLAEQYLIRAESRARSGDGNGARADLNVIRERAGLEPFTSSDMNALLNAIVHERRAELFGEWGHRWLDLKRTGMIDAVMEQHPDWKSTDALYPIPLSQINNSPVRQNDGY